MKHLASVRELESPPFRSFMALVNAFASAHGLRVHTDWSKVWEYPWVWQSLQAIRLPGLKILDIGSELSPMPWFFASLGSSVSMVEKDPELFALWSGLRDRFGFDVDWRCAEGCGLPHHSDTFDVVTSFSVIEHIEDKAAAVDETVRVLKPGGLLCLTFDVCEASMGMTFPAWNGAALDLASFDRLVWSRPDLEPVRPDARWNTEDMEAFRKWNLQSAPHHNYVVGGAVLRKRTSVRTAPAPGTGKRTRVHFLDTGLGSGNIGDDAMFLGAAALLPPEFDIDVELHDLSRRGQLPPGPRYVHVQDQPALEESIAAAEAAWLVGDTPVMDQWGLDWPLRSNAPKLALCHRLGKPVHAVGVGVDRLVDPEALTIFAEVFRPVASWSVRSERCRRALLDMGVPEERILLGADWAWLIKPGLDASWAEDRLRACGVAEGGMRIGVNAVNEIWRGVRPAKRALAGLLDSLAEQYGAQIVFLCNESRPGEYYDGAAAASVQALMRRPSVLVPPEYYSVDQMVSLIGRMNATISQRYHFTLFSVLAGVCPVSIDRGQKMRGLREELELPRVGDMTAIDDEAFGRAVQSALENPAPLLRQLEVGAAQLARRAANNLALVRYSPCPTSS